MHDRVWDRLNGSLGVIIFFVLSGYLITMLALREEKARGRLDFAAFYIRRACRIFPLYYLVLAVHIVLIFGLKMFSDKAQMFARTLPYHLAYFQEVPFFLRATAVAIVSVLPELVSRNRRKILSDMAVDCIRGLSFFQSAQSNCDGKSSFFFLSLAPSCFRQYDGMRWNTMPTF